MYSYGPPRMAEQKEDNQLEHTYSSYVMIRDVALKTCQRRWTIRKSGKRGSGISVLAPQHDDDDDKVGKIPILGENNKRTWLSERPICEQTLASQVYYRKKWIENLILLCGKNLIFLKPKICSTVIVLFSGIYIYIYIYIKSIIRSC